MTHVLGDFGENTTTRIAPCSFCFFLSPPRLQDRINAPRTSARYIVLSRASRAERCSSGSRYVSRNIIAGDIRLFSASPPRDALYTTTGFTDSLRAAEKRPECGHYTEDIRGVARRNLFIRENARRLSNFREQSAPSSSAAFRFLNRDRARFLPRCGEKRRDRATTSKTGVGTGESRPSASR